jgi:hypothetical protein
MIGRLCVGVVHEQMDLVNITTKAACRNYHQEERVKVADFVVALVT